jgi:hypothetical protein
MPGTQPTPVIPDVGKAAQAWAKENTRLNAVLKGRVSSRLPVNALFPYLTTFVIPAGSVDNFAPIASSLVQWSCFGARSAKGQTQPDWDAASGLAWLLVACLTDIGGEPIAGGGALADASIQRGPARMPEPTGLARYDVDSFITVLPQTSHA